MTNQPKTMPVQWNPHGIVGELADARQRWVYRRPRGLADFGDHLMPSAGLDHTMMGIRSAPANQNELEDLIEDRR